MRKIKEILRLFHGAGLSRRQVARCLSLSRDTVAVTLERAGAAGLAWPLPEGVDEARLEARLYPQPDVPSRGERPLPDWSVVHRELRRKGVTLRLLWEEYKALHPDGYQYSWYCDRYRVWRERIDVVMRQEHRAGEKLFVDYAGQTVEVIDPSTGEVHPAQVFVAVLGASNYTYAEATRTQSLPDWVASHKRTFEFLGGVPEIIVPDNLKVGVHHPHRYEPDVNPTYQDLALHYGTAVIPTRTASPRDKAKVEVGVQIVERWILARLRHRRFFSLHELNDAIADLVDQLNRRPFKKLDGSRLELFEMLDRPVLRPLPPTPYVYAEWRKARVNIDYHVEADAHYYSVPYQYARRQLDVRITATTVECFFRGKRIASHARSMRRGRHTTQKAHMPESHRLYADWTPDRITEWAGRTGPATARLVERIIASRTHPQQGYRTCLGILRLGEAYGAERLEAAAERALAIGALSYRSVASILKHRLEERPLREGDHVQPVRHENIRGADYYGAAPNDLMNLLNPDQNYEC